MRGGWTRGISLLPASGYREPVLHCWEPGVCISGWELDLLHQPVSKARHGDARSPFEPRDSPIQEAPHPPQQRRSDVLVASAWGCCQGLSICPSFGKVHEKELPGNSTGGEMGTGVGLWDGEGLNKGGQQGGGLKDELRLEGRCWSWS